MRGDNVVIRVLVLALALAGALVTDSAAQDKGPNTGRLSFTGGIDFPTDYFFRGIVQERDSFLEDNYIVQPYGDLTFKLWEGAGPLSAVGLTFGLWNSLHGGPSGVEGSASVDPKMWYEADFYTKLSATVLEDLAAAVIYTAYMSPNDRFPTVQELAFSLGYNDSKLLGPFALNPSVLLAVEVKGQADTGRHRGTLLQLGVSPGLTLFDKSRTPVSVTFPLQVSLSLDEYYERISVGGEDDTFGYASGGISASVPLRFIPSGFGAWQGRAGVALLFLGDNLETANSGDETEVIGSVGLALTY
jgi:hypothetical protein